MERYIIRSSPQRYMYPYLRLGNLYRLINQIHVNISSSTISPHAIPSVHHDALFNLINKRLVFCFVTNVLGYTIAGTNLSAFAHQNSSGVASSTLSENSYLQCFHCSARISFIELTHRMNRQHLELTRFIINLSELHCASCPSRSKMEAFFSQGTTQSTEEGTPTHCKAGRKFRFSFLI